MFGKNFAKEIDNGSFFEQMDDLLDIDDAVFTTDFPPIWSSSAAAAADSLFSGHTHDSGHYHPYEDIVQSEWLSNCADNSFLGAGTLTVHTSPLTPSNQFQSSSPDSGEVCSCPAAAEKEKAWFRRDENGVRKCLHCEVTKTPQWRVGPLGPKTLCNACGVRYSSGRLFPEYRPAASPSFVPSLHSNSHKKVLQMRAKQTAGAHSDC